MLWVGVRKGKLTHGVMSFSDVGLELSCMQFAPWASLTDSWSTSFQFKPPRKTFLGGSPPTALVLFIADIYLRQMRVTNSDTDLLSSETVHELISCYTAR